MIVIGESSGSDGGAASFFVCDKTFFLNEFGGATVVGIVVIIFVDDGVHHDGLFVNC